MVKPMKFLWSSDHHTLHNKTPTSHILTNLSQFLMKEHNLADIDLIMFGGDFMDRLVETNNHDFLKVMAWSDQFLLACEKHNVVVRFLEGTSSHDWGQQKHFRLGLFPKLNAKYIGTLSIEIIPELNNLSILYVPDNLSGSKTPDQIWEMALETLSSHHLTQVDFVNIHGGFRHQLPEKGWKHAHMIERWKTIAKYAIFAGHIHIPCVIEEDKFYGAGSFDRTRHAEEHPKGGFVGTLHKASKHFNVEFWENKKAMPYVTLKLSPEWDLSTTVTYINNLLIKRKFIPGSHIKLRGGVPSVVNPLLQEFIKQFPLLNFTVDNETADNLLVDETLYETTTYKGVTLTKENLFDSLYVEVEKEFTELGISKTEIEDVLNEFL